MAISNKIDNFEMIVNQAFVNKAQYLDPQLIESQVIPVPNSSAPMGRGDRLLLDFGDHQVGYLCFDIHSVGSPADAPCKMRIRFAELPFELEEDWSSYHGDISSAWLQEEIHFVDLMPSHLQLPRRHAFRYVEIVIMDTTPKYQVVLSHISCRSVSSADYANVEELKLDDPELMALDKVSLRTMHQCMQSVFEDGPKRDRRLWLGDLRLQALGNYYTFKNNDLVKRCLYLFAGLTMNEGQVGACLFHEPTPQVDDTALFDYSLFFVSTLHDYYEATGDMDTLKELYPTARRQIELSLRKLGENGIVKDRDDWWCFLDWGDGLNKQAGANAVLLYALKQAHTIASWLALGTDYYDQEAQKLQKAIKDNLWDPEQGYFISGADCQVSWASQVWCILAGVLDMEENQQLLKRMIRENPPIPMVTPYLYHHFVEALFQCDMKDEAVRIMKSYWGEMIRDGADTFYELYDPENKDHSPYGGRIIHSFCHAWSSTPSYFIRKYLM